LTELSLLCRVLPGENPILKPEDAVAVAVRAGKLKYCVQRGNHFDVRFSDNSPMEVIYRDDICQRIYDHLFTSIVKKAVAVAKDEDGHPVIMIVNPNKFPKNNPIPCVEKKTVTKKKVAAKK